MPSIKDVAKLAGVSVMTASRVMNNNPSVSPEARRLVIEASKQLGYQPNLTARSLRSRRSNLFGLLVPDLENPVFAALAKHVEEVAGNRGYNVMIGNTWEDPKRERDMLNLMLARQMDGIIVAPVSAENTRVFTTCPQPLVVIDRTLPGAPSLPSVTVDNQEIGRFAARYFLESGHTQFACIAGPEKIDVFADRLSGFQEELAAQGKKPASVARVEITGKLGLGASVADTIFQKTKRFPLALFCANDVTALGAMQAAHRRGLSLPRDVSIIGVDGIPVGELATPPLTTVKQPFPDMAAAGVELLLETISNKKAIIKRIVLAPEMLERESVCALPRRTSRKRVK